MEPALPIAVVNVKTQYQWEQLLNLVDDRVAIILFFFFADIVNLTIGHIGKINTYFNFL